MHKAQKPGTPRPTVQNSAAVTPQRFALGGSAAPKIDEAELKRLLVRYPNPKSVLNANILQGSSSPYLREMSPELYGFLGGLAGTAPDQFEGSVLDPLSARVQAGANYGFPIGTALNVLPTTPAIGRGAVGALSRVGTGPVGRSAQFGVIKAPGGNWLSGSVEDALKGLKTPGYTHINDAGMAVAEGYGRPMTAEELITRGPQPSHTALNQFVDKQLTRYVQKDMATPNDPVRALAERGILHFDPRTVRQPMDAREAAGFQAVDYGTSPLARKWERTADDLVLMQRAGKYKKAVGPNAWLAQTAPDVPVHSLQYTRTSAGELGFDHLMDELRNATNPASGLPANLLLKPESLSRVSVPQAVERVAKINAWREAQKVAADQALANNAATVLHKDYPDKGFKWVELKKQDQLPEGWQAGEKDPYARTQFTNPKGERTYDDPTVGALRDALKYEGDTMGHCVGGYCDDVASGKSRIYSLRDAKGQPHTTIEVVPKGAVFSDVAKHIGSERANELLDQGVTLSEMIKGIPDFQYPQAIKQIKGKGNRKPNDEYLPYVQDFVKSGKWSAVRDVENSGLVEPESLLTDVEIATLKAAGSDVQAFHTPSELRGMLEAAKIPHDYGELSANPLARRPQGFAKGGAVSPARQLAIRLGVMDLIPKGY